MTIITSKQSQPSALSLDHRIADAFSSELSSEAVSALLNEANEVAELALGSNEKAKTIAFDPATRPEDVAKARKEMEDCQFTSDRLSIAAEKLQGLLVQAREREARTAAQGEYELAVSERDALAKELAAKYPGLQQALCDLLERVAASDDRIRRINMASVGPWIYPAEMLARPVPDNWLTNPDGNFPPFVQGLRLPNWGSGYAWPKPSRY